MHTEGEQLAGKPAIESLSSYESPRADVNDLHLAVEQCGDMDPKKVTTNDVITRLLESRERFAKTFKTERGSVYFVTDSGHSLRFKRVQGKNEKGETWDYMLPSIIFKNIFFVNEETADKAIQTADDGFLGFKIKPEEYKIGTYPFEINMEGEDNTALLESQEESTVVLTGYRDKKGGEHQSGVPVTMHVGHKISVIL